MNYLNNLNTFLARTKRLLVMIMALGCLTACANDRASYIVHREIVGAIHPPQQPVAEPTKSSDQILPPPYIRRGWN